MRAATEESCLARNASVESATGKFCDLAGRLSCFVEAAVARVEFPLDEVVARVEAALEVAGVETHLPVDLEGVIVTALAAVETLVFRESRESLSVVSIVWTCLFFGLTGVSGFFLR
jgi:hypothetical protein